MAEVKTRKKNFSVEERNLLVNLVKENTTTLFGKFGSQLSNADRKSCWAKIAVSVSALGVDVRTADEVSVKYKNIKSETKAKLQRFKRAQNQTGGGSPPRQEDFMGSAESVVAETYTGSPAFEGLNGFDSAAPAGKYFLSFNYKYIESIPTLSAFVYCMCSAKR